MSKVQQGPWDELNRITQALTPEQQKRLENKQEAIESEQTEAIREALNNPAGQRMLDLLHIRFVDQPRFDPANTNPVYAGFYSDGMAAIVRIMEIASRPLEGG